MPDFLEKDWMLDSIFQEDANVSNQMETFPEFFGTGNKEFFPFLVAPRSRRLPELEEVHELKLSSGENLPEPVEFLENPGSSNRPALSVILPNVVQIAGELFGPLV